MPAWCRQRRTIAKVDGVYNAVVTNGNFVGENIAIGRGAGRGPTASAIVADLHGHRPRPHPAGLLGAGRNFGTQPVRRLLGSMPGPIICA